MSAELHILHVFSSAGLYGAEHAVLGLMPALAREGIASTLACIDNPHLERQPLYERARSLGLQAERIPCSGRFDSATTRSLRTLVARHPGAIMHVHGYKSTFYALRARRGHPDVPVVSTLHGWVTNTRSLWLYRILELWMLRRVQCICIVARGMRKPLTDAGIPDNRIHLVENGIDTDRFRPDPGTLCRSDIGVPSDAFVFGAVQRLSDEKNPLGLLEAFAHVAKDVAQARLVIVGDGPRRGEFERRATTLGIAERVHVLGARQDTERLYPLFDCFVLASLTEGLPLALLEAMACARPVVASAVGQVPAVLEDLPATLVPAGDGEALASAMRDALRPAPPIGMRHRVLARYSVARMAHDYAAIYRELGGQHARKAA